VDLARRLHDHFAAIGGPQVLALRLVNREPVNQPCPVNLAQIDNQEQVTSGLKTARKPDLHFSVAGSHCRTVQGEIFHLVAWECRSELAQSVFRVGRAKAFTAALISEGHPLSNQQVVEKLVGSGGAASPFAASPDDKPEHTKQ
jgi:hypothetical protein